MIVEKFLDKLLPHLAPLGITELDSWEFGRTYSKKNPEAIKWVLKPQSRKEKRILASSFSVNELLKYDSFEIRPWQAYLLVFPQVIDPVSLPAQAKLTALQQEISKTLSDFDQGLMKPKDAVSRTLDLLSRVVANMRGQPESKPTQQGTT